MEGELYPIRIIKRWFYAPVNHLLQDRKMSPSNLLALSVVRNLFYHILSFFTFLLLSALRSPVALAQRHDKIHTLRVRTPRFDSTWKLHVVLLTKFDILDLLKPYILSCLSVLTSLHHQVKKWVNRFTISGNPISI